MMQKTAGSTCVNPVESDRMMPKHQTFEPLEYTYQLSTSLKQQLDTDNRLYHLVTKIINNYIR